MVKVQERNLDFKVHSRYMTENLTFPSTSRPAFANQEFRLYPKTHLDIVKIVGNGSYNLSRSEWVSATFSRFYAICHCALCSGREVRHQRWNSNISAAGILQQKRYKYPFVHLTNIIEWYYMAQICDLSLWLVKKILYILALCQHALYWLYVYEQKNK